MEYDAIEFASHADGTVPYKNYGKSFNEIIGKLEIDISNIYEWFHHDGFKASPEKFHFLVSAFVGRARKIMESTIKTSK